VHEHRGERGDERSPGRSTAAAAVERTVAAKIADVVALTPAAAAR
jgi:hypothetical protein